MTSKLIIHPFKLKVKLGCEAWEREKLQYVSFKVLIKFQNSLTAERSDKIKDTVCYSRISELVSQEVSSKEFRLIEHLAFIVFSNIKKNLPKKSQLELSVHKHKPPVKILDNGVSYVISEL